MANENARKTLPGWLLLAASVAVMLAVTMRARRPSPDSGGSLGQHPSIGKAAQDFELEFPPGTKTSLSKLRGKAILLNFWASWCEPCMEEMPSLAKLEKELAGKPFLLLALNADDEKPGVHGITAGQGVPQNLIYDFARTSLNTYEVDSIPLSVLIDRKGIIREVFLGPRDWTDAATLGAIRAAID